MGRSQKLRSDTEKAKPHEEGASIEIVQILAHDQLGAIRYVWPRHWIFHCRAAEDAFNQLAELHARLVKFPVHEVSAMRCVADMEYLESVYRAGTSMVIEIVLALQHLCDEIERIVKIQPQGSALDERLREALANAGMTAPADREGYAKFIELEQIRNAIEHPKPGNTYNAEPGQWDKVPLAWFLSERGIKAFQGCSAFLKSIIDEWEVRRNDFDQLGELTVQRGIHSQLQFKKSRDR